MTGEIPLARKPEDWEATCYVASQEMFVGFFLRWEDAKLSAAASELLAACKSLSRLGEDPRSCMFPEACPGPEVEPVDNRPSFVHRHQQAYFLLPCSQQVSRQLWPRILRWPPSSQPKARRSPPW
jgi:hypothetical protein